MSKPFDYSKWDNIELSDDEDDVHPNIDRESWFRMKHRSRVEREEQEEKDKKRIEDEMKGVDFRIEEITRILDRLNRPAEELDEDDELEDKEGLEAELAELKKSNDERQSKLDSFEKNKKWNVDNMCRVVEERTIINPKASTAFSPSGYALPGSQEQKDPPPKAKSSKEGKTSQLAKAENHSKIISDPEEKKQVENAEPKLVQLPSEPTVPDYGMLDYHEFTERYADIVEEFMAISSMDKTKEFLIQHGNTLLQENASNYLLLASLEDEMNGFRDKMRQTARQSQIISNITELAKSLKQHPGNVILPFFHRMEQPELFQGFQDGLETFIDRIIKRAVVKKQEIDSERLLQAQEDGVNLQEMPKEQRLGPGGLDPVEVFESLPESMQKAFESRDVEELKKALLAMTDEEADRHMSRCTASGLWNSNE